MDKSDIINKDMVIKTIKESKNFKADNTFKIIFLLASYYKIVLLYIFQYLR